jgi:UDP-N-acetylmuramoylalanine--D-glutamate ligase
MNKALILGYGKTGKAIEKFLKTEQQYDQILIYDEQDLRLQNQIFDMDENLAKDIKKVFCSPGFRTLFNQNSFIKKLQTLNLEIFSDIDLFLSKLPKNKKVIAVTGTNGKSTTTALITHLLNTNGKSAIACGNIGLAVFDVDISRYEYFVIEISSAQLEISRQLKFNCGVFLNLTNDHIEYHGNIQNYSAAKEKILTSSEFSFVNTNLQFTKNYTNLQTFSSEDQKANIYVKNQEVYINQKKCGIFLNDMLKGQHSQENIAASTGVCLNLGININDICKSLESFKNLEHRFEFVNKLNNITFINDSKATNIDSSLKALEASDRSVILIAGGKYKGCDLSLLKQFKDKILKIYLIGQDVSEILPQLSEFNTEYVKSLDNATKKSIEFGISFKKDCIVLLSPFCASFDQFKNFEERGTVFKDLVKSFIC